MVKRTTTWTLTVVFCALVAQMDAAAGPATWPAEEASTMPATSRADKELAARVAGLVERLAGDRFRDREAAMAELKALGPRVALLVQKYRDHPDAEVRARIEEILADPAWIASGAMIRFLRRQHRSPMSGLKFQAGDVLFKIDSTRITDGRLPKDLGPGPYQCCFVRSGKVVEQEFGDLGFMPPLSNWRLDRGGAQQVQGVVALAAGEHAEAFRHLVAAEAAGMEDEKMSLLTVGLAERQGPHDQADRLMAAAIRRFGWGNSGEFAYSLHDSSHAGLPVSAVYDRHLEHRLASDRPLTLTEYWQFEVRFGTTLDAIRRLQKRPWPGEKVIPTLPYDLLEDHCGTLVRLAAHEGRWADAVAAFRRYGRPAQSARHALTMAALHAGSADDLEAAMRAGLAQRDDRRPRNYTLILTTDPILPPVAALILEGHEARAKALLAELVAMEDVDWLASILKGTNRHVLFHGAVVDTALPYVRRAAERCEADEVKRLYLECLALSAGLTAERWKEEFERFGPEKPTEELNWVSAVVQMRLGRYEEARELTKGTIYGANLGALKTALDFLTEHAGRLDGDYRALRTTLAMYRGAAKGSLWAIRADGSTAYVDASGALRQVAGTEAGQLPQGLYGEQIWTLPTGTIYVRRNQVYLLDEKAIRWIRTGASHCGAWSDRTVWKWPDAPTVLRAMLAAVGENRVPSVHIRSENAFQGWTISLFRGGIYVFYTRQPGSAVNLSLEIARRTGRAGLVRLDSPVLFAKDCYLFTGDAGAWYFPKDGKVQPVDFGLPRNDVPVSLRFRDGTYTFHVAPSAGGGVFECPREGSVPRPRPSKHPNQYRLSPGYIFVCGHRDTWGRIPEDAPLQARYERRLAREGKKP